MKAIAYSHIDLQQETVPGSAFWLTLADRIYQDRGDRTQLQQLISDCRVEPAQVLFVERLSVLGDSPEEVGDRLRELQTLDIQVIPTEALLGDTGLKASDLITLLQNLQAQQPDPEAQAKTISHRLRQTHARNRVQALPPPGKAPFGYRRGKDHYVVDRTAAPIVRAFFEHFLLYGSLRGSVRHLQEKFNKRISPSTGQRWLTSAIYRGNLEYQTGEVIPNTHTALLSEAEAAQIDRLLRRNRSLAARSASAPRSLAGLVTCHTCQSPMTVTRVTAPRHTQEYLYLRPVACPQSLRCKAIPYNLVLEQTIQRICEDLPRAIDGLMMPSVDALKQGFIAQIESKQAVLEKLPALIGDGILDEETAALRTFHLKTEIAQLQAQMAQLPPVNLRAIAQVVSLPQFWQDLSEAERRFYFREFIRQIELHHQEEELQVRLVFIF